MKKIRYLFEHLEDRAYDVWNILQVCDTKKEALDVCQRHIRERSWARMMNENYPPQRACFRIVKRVEEVIFTEEGTEE